MVKAAEKQGDRKDPLKNHERSSLPFFSLPQARAFDRNKQSMFAVKEVGYFFTVNALRTLTVIWISSTFSSKLSSRWNLSFIPWFASVKS